MNVENMARGCVKGENIIFVNMLGTGINHRMEKFIPVTGFSITIQWFILYSIHGKRMLETEVFGISLIPYFTRLFNNGECSILSVVYHQNTPTH